MTDLCLQIIKLIRCSKYVDICLVTNHVEDTAQCDIKRRILDFIDIIDEVAWIMGAYSPKWMLSDSVDTVFCILNSIRTHIGSR